MAFVALYTLYRHEYADSPPNAPSLTAVIDSFRPKIIRVNVAKKPDHLQDSVLDVSEEASDTGATGSERGGITIGKDKQPLDRLWSIVDR